MTQEKTTSRGNLKFLFRFGGQDYSDKNFMLNLETGKHFKLPNLIKEKKIKGSSMIYLRGRGIFAFGGYDYEEKKFYSSIRALEFRNELQWKEIAKMTTKRECCAISKISEKKVFIFGWGKCEIFDLDSKKCKLLKAKSKNNHFRSEILKLPINDKVYMVGGYDMYGFSLFDCKKMKIYQLTETEKMHYWYPGLQIKENIVTVFGDDGNEKLWGVVERLDLRENSLKFKVVAKVPDFQGVCQQFLC